MKLIDTNLQFTSKFELSMSSSKYSPLNKVIILANTIWWQVSHFATKPKTFRPKIKPKKGCQITNHKPKTSIGGFVNGEMLFCPLKGSFRVIALTYGICLVKIIVDISFQYKCLCWSGVTSACFLTLKFKKETWITYCNVEWFTCTIQALLTGRYYGCG